METAERDSVQGKPKETALEAADGQWRRQLNGSQMTTINSQWNFSSVDGEVKRQQWHPGLGIINNYRMLNANEGFS